MTTDDINQLPVLTTNGSGGATGAGNIRNPLQEMILLPGTAFQNDTAVVVNGLPANSENIRIEGQDSTSNIWKIAQQNSQGGVDAIQEVAIQTSNFNAEYGQAAGGYFNYTMKSGTNQLHGSAYDYFVNEAFKRRSALYRPMQPKRNLLHGSSGQAAHPQPCAPQRLRLHDRRPGADPQIV